MVGKESSGAELGETASGAAIYMTWRIWTHKTMPSCVLYGDRAHQSKGDEHPRGRTNGRTRLFHRCNPRARAYFSSFRSAQRAVTAELLLP